MNFWRPSKSDYRCAQHNRIRNMTVPKPAKNFPGGLGLIRPLRTRRPGRFTPANMIGHSQPFSLTFSAMSQASESPCLCNSTPSARPRFRTHAHKSAANGCHLPLARQTSLRGWRLFQPPLPNFPITLGGHLGDGCCPGRRWTWSCRSSPLNSSESWLAAKTTLAFATYA
jgi:hypothetical protein